MVPPLRQRPGDALQLARSFCREFAQRYRREELQLAPAAEAAIGLHAWPGNVRELRNLMEQAVMLATGPLIAVDELMLPGKALPSLAATPPTAIVSALDRAEREQILSAMGDAQQNVSQAARLLGISRDTLRYRLDKHGLRP
jgi:DNA-binding NtrC family response regulator